MNIGVIIQSPDMGGAETYMVSLMREWKKRKSNILFASNNKKLIQISGSLPRQKFHIPIIIDFMGNIRGLIKSIIILPLAILYYSFLLHTFKKSEVDVILMSGFSEKMLVTVLASLFKIPIIWIEYGPLDSIFMRNFGIPKYLYHWISPLVGKVIVPSKSTQRNLLKYSRIPPSKIKIVYLGVKILRKNLPSGKSKTKKIIVGNVSRLTREKGQDVILRSIPEIVDKVKNVRFIFVGTGPDMLYFQNLAKHLRIEKYVEFLGYVEDLGSVYEIMDIFVFPTMWELEGFGLVAAEAMSFGIPVVASRLGPVPEIVDDKKTGILFEPGNDRELARAVVLLADNEDLRYILGTNAYKKAQEEYNIETAAMSIYTILVDAITHEKKDKL